MEEARKDDLLQLCQELIRQPSPSGEESKVAQLIKSVMLPLGFQVEVDLYGNVIGSFQFEREGPTLLYEAQMDQADPGDVSKWSSYPFGGTIRGNRIYGRGATDQKGILAAMILSAFWLASDMANGLRGKIVVAATVHQETFELPVSRKVAERVKPDFVVSGEASSLSIERGQRGRASIVFETIGRMVHSSMAEEGSNSVEQMVNFIQELRNLRTVRKDPFFGENSMVLTDILSYPRDNRTAVPSLCRAVFDRRLLLGEDQNSLMDEVNKLMRDITRGREDLCLKSYMDRGDGLCYTGTLIEADRFAPAWEMDRDHPFIDIALKGVASAGLEPILSERAGFGSNGCVYGGELRIPTIVFGPSKRELAHIVDEYIDIEQLILGCEGYYGIAREVLS